MKKTILIVDDEPIITRALSRALEKSGFVILTAPDGKAGLKAIADHHPDLILLDIMMPELTGLEVLEKMRELGISTPTILMTAYGDGETEKKAKLLGVSAYITKPFTHIDDVVRLIERNFI